MTALRLLQPVEFDALPDYPVAPDARLDTHEFLRWEVDRWLASDMRWNGSHECKSIWFELLNLSYRETPVGTLPRDPDRLARMVQPVVEVRQFNALCGMEYGPLHGWRPCRCGDDVRLMHDFLTDIVLRAFASRANHAARVEAASQARRLKRLTEDVARLNLNVAADPRKVRFIDDFLQDRVAQRGGSRRTQQDLDAAMQACIAKDRVGGFPDRP